MKAPNIMISVAVALLGILGARAADPRDFTADPTLPGFHFVPYPFEWMNDPNGPMYDPVHEMYHLFYQYKTPRTWGHAASKDLVNWVQLPVALDMAESYDEGGDYSGSATVLNDYQRTVVLSVSSSTENMFFAFPKDRSDPYLTEWEYFDGNPIFSTPARDPTEMWQDEEFRYQLAVGTFNGTALWRSDATESPLQLDANWSYVGLIQEGEQDYYWECPDLFQLPSSFGTDQEVWISKHSLDGQGDYFDMGYYDWETGLFTKFKGSQTNQMYDRNTAFYASKTFLDPVQSRRVLWGWLRMFPWPSDDETFSTWQCAQSVPREVDFELNADGSYTGVNAPIAELASLRDEDTAHSTEVLLRGGDSTASLTTTGTMLDIVANVTAQGADMQCGFDVLHSYKGNDGLRVMTPTIGQGDTVPMRLLVDASIVETFIGRTAETFFKLDVTAQSTGVSVVSVGAGYCKFSIESWTMNPFEFDVSLVEA